MGFEFSQKSGVDLIQNCDLPPPQKVFTTSDKTVAASMAAIHRFKGREEVEYGGFGNGEEKLELMKALRLSQTRAREAEKKAAKLVEERDCISKAFLDEARLIFCYRQSVKLLELRVSKSRRQGQQDMERIRDSDSSQLTKEEEEAHGDEDDGGGMKWIWAFAICLSVAGIGFMLGYRSLT